MSKTISTSISTGFTLTSAYDPLSITSTGSIVTSAQAAIYGDTSQAWQIYNAGLIDGLGSFGIELQSGSTVSNSGTVQATASSSDALRISNGAGTVFNSGSIFGGFDAVALRAGGSVNNTGIIIGTHDDGIAIAGGAGTVTNAGSIIGNNAAVSFSGTFADRVILDPGAYFLGAVKGGTGTNTLELAAGTSAATGTLNNFATGFTAFGTIAIDAGASWTFGGANSVGSSVTLTDDGALSNAGQIDTTVTVAGGGSVANSATISGAAYGITLQAGGTVSNTGSDSLIKGQSYGIGAVAGPAVVTNGGTIYGGETGVRLSAGGTIVNTGNIVGQLNFGVYISGGAGTVTNAGNISTNFDVPDAVYFKGNYADKVILDPGASFGGSLVQGGSGTNTLELAAGTSATTGTLVTATFVDFGTVTVDSGADWIIDGTLTGTLNNAGIISSGVNIYEAGFVQNSGTINSAVVDGFGVYAPEGGTIVNTGLIYGSGRGVEMSGGPEIVTNHGTISGEFGGADLIAGTIDNYGLIKTTSADTDSALEAAIDIAIGFNSTVTNSGTISGGPDSAGIYIDYGGTVTNSGTVTGGAWGIDLVGGPATVTTSGSIGGGSYAIQFSGSYADRLIVDPGASFSGLVQGGSGTNTLELAAGTAGATGTLGGFGTQFLGFGTVAIDTGAAWQFSSTGSVGGGVTLTDSGTLDNAGQIDTTVTLGAGASFGNTGTISLPSSAAYGVFGPQGGIVDNAGLITGASIGVRIDGAAGTIINSGTVVATGFAGAYLTDGGSVTNSGTLTGGNYGIRLTGAGTVINSGSIGGGVEAVLFSGSYVHRLIVDPGASFSGLVTALGGPNTLELAEGTAGTTGTLNLDFGGFSTLSVDTGASWQFAGGEQIDDDALTLIDLGTLNNAGLIQPTVTLGAGASLGNTGTITAFSPSAYGVFGNQGGTINNAGTIGNVVVAVGVYLGGAGSTITNTGTIYGNETGVDLTSGGTLTNSGALNGGSIGIRLTGSGTVINSGSIGGGTYAIEFRGLANHSLVVDPGAVFSGQVYCFAGNNTLELAAGTAGATGTLSGFGTAFYGFNTISIDAGASWQFDTSETVAARVALIDAGTLNNDGQISTSVYVTNGASFGNTGTVSIIRAEKAVYGTQGGNVYNAALISGRSDGVYILNAAGTVTNHGTISAGYNGVYLGQGGAVENTGTILTTSHNSIEQGIGIGGDAGTITNSGTIYGGTWGANLDLGGTVTNTGTLTGGSYGIYISGFGTVINSGTISGGTFAVDFQGDFADSVVVDPGAVFDGVVQGGSGINTLELAAGTGGATGTLSSFGTEFANFGSIVVDSGAKWELDGAAPAMTQTIELAGTGDLLGIGSPSTFADEIIWNWNSSDELDLTGLAYVNGATATLSGSTLTVTSGSTTDTLTLKGAGFSDLPAGTTFKATDDGTPAHGTLVREAACYCSGTRILTSRGEVEVQNLTVGDQIVTASGGHRPIKWIGRRAYAPHFANANRHLLPIRFNAGSLGENLPLRDLHVSPKHAMFIDGVLIPAECLVNGVSIVKTTRVDTALAYWHIELETHDVLLAEGAASESFVDDNSRFMFHNAHEYWAEHPDDTGREATYCAPRVEDGYHLAAIRARLAAIAGIARPQNHGALSGYFTVANGTVSGWARNELHPRASVCLDILVEGRRVAQTLANRILPNIVVDAHGFEIPLPAECSGEVELRRSSDGMKLAPANALAQAA